MTPQGNVAQPDARVFNVLRAARARLENASAWTRGVRARDRDNRPVAPGDPAAVAWRLDAALELAAGGDRRLLQLAHAQLERVIGHRTTVQAWADAVGHASTLALLDLASTGTGAAWAGAGLLDLAASLIDDAYLELDLRHSACRQCGTKHHRNTEHADLGRQLRDLPDKLRRAAKRGTDSVLLGKGDGAAVSGRREDER